MDLKIIPKTQLACDFIEQNKASIAQWLNSEKFANILKENPNLQAFPPLLDPDSIDYSKCPPELAWELNLPLPPRYFAAYLGEHATGHNAFMRFLQECGFCILIHYKQSGMQRYIEFYNALLDNQYPNKIVNLAELDFEECDKFCALASFRVNSIISLVRDPISILKSIINCDNANLIRNINFNTKSDFKTAFENSALYGAYDEKTNCHFASLFPCLDSIKNIINKAKGKYEKMLYSNLKGCEMPGIALRGGFFFNELVSRFIGGGGGPRQIAVLDFNEILPQNAYSTMCKICDLFEIPNPKNKEFFESKMYGNLAAFTPFNLWVGGDFSENSAPPSTKAGQNSYLIIIGLSLEEVKERRGVLVHITSAQWYDSGNVLKNYTYDLKPLIMNTKEFQSTKLQKIFSGEFGAEFSALRFYTSQAEAQFLGTKDGAKVKSELIKALAKALFEINSAALKNAKKKIKEREVLEYFKNNPLLAKEFASICQKAYAPLKSIRADILASWKYYNEFLDSIKTDSIESEK